MLASKLILECDVGRNPPEDRGQASDWTIGLSPALAPRLFFFRLFILFYFLLDYHWIEEAGHRTVLCLCDGQRGTT